MKIWMDKRLVSRVLLSFSLFTALILILAACGTTTPAATPTPTPVAQATVAATATPPPAQATPSPTTGTTQPAVPLKGIRMLDTQNGWALTASSILKTADGG